MNFFNQFTDSWNSRFSNQSHSPSLDCLKADHFGSLLDQKQSLEFEESKRCCIIKELKLQLDHELFVVEFLHRCIQKLAAVSQVFSEFDQSDSKSSSSSGTSHLPAASGCSPPLTFNGPLNHHAPKFSSTACSNFSLLPQCLASSLIQSASPLLAAAAATSSGSLFLPTSLPPFSYTGPIKLEPEQYVLGGHTSKSVSPGSHHRASYDSVPRLSGPSFPSMYHNQSSANTFSGSPIVPLPFTHHQSAVRPESQGQFVGSNDRVECQLADYRQPLASVVSSEAQAHAAAAVAAAFGLGFNHAGTKSLQSFGNSTDYELPRNYIRNGIDKEHSTLPSSTTTNDRPYQCATCSRGFSVKAGLVQHMRTHTDERPYPCPQCGRAFKQKIQLTTHIRVHSGERPYGCRLCGKLFRQQSHVVQHLRTHTGEKPHKCYQCGKAFRQKYSLISHQRRLCRNRSAANPIAAGMTMWISPGIDGDTCNLVKEFSPTLQPANNLTSPISEITNPIHSPCSPLLVPSRVAISPVPHSALFNSNTSHQVCTSLSGRHSQSDSLSAQFDRNETAFAGQPQSSAYSTPVDVAGSNSPIAGHADVCSDEEKQQSPSTIIRRCHSNFISTN